MKAVANELQQTIVREFDAPRALVWEVWTDPKHAAHWWGPRGHSCSLYEADVRAGGAFRIHTLAPDGSLCKHVGTYEAVVAPESFTQVGSVEHRGAKLLDIRTAATFEELDGRTKVTLRDTYFNIAANVDANQFRGDASEGWSQTLDRLGEYVAERGA
jgi:uncharacterized protein YndB with AHSA1/START domain